jgi:hypothetical protein
VNKLSLYFQLTKIDEANRSVSGIATAELPDKSGEICDYEGTKPYYQKWSDTFKKNTDGKSLGNLRSMHTAVAAGKLTAINFNDVAKAIEITAKVVDDAEWNKVVEGVYSGFSQGGEYVKKWKDGAYQRYIADPSEVSLVDNPCLAAATFEVVKADGTTEMRKFQHKESQMPEVEQVWKAADGSTFATKAEAMKKNAQLEADAEAAALAKTSTDALAAATATLDEIPPTDEETKAKADKAEKMAAVATLAKESTFDLSQAVEALGVIEWLYEREAAEALLGEDADQQQVEDLKAAIARLKSFIASEATEDVGEDGALERILGENFIKAAKFHAEHKAAIGEIHKSAVGIMDHVQKCLAGDVKKADHHTKADHEHIEKVHGAAVDIADKCMKMVGDSAKPLEDEHKQHVHAMHKSATSVMDSCHKFLKGEGVEKAANHDEHDVAQLHKMHGHASDIADKCVKIFGEAKPVEDGNADNKKDKNKSGSAEQEPVEKLMKAEALNASLTKALGDIQGTVGDLLKRIDHLERLPAERKGKIFIAKRGDEVETGTQTPDDVALKTDLRLMRLSPEEMRKAAGF